MASATDDLSVEKATEEEPYRGAVVHRQWPEIELAEFELWFDDDVYVYRAVDFDVIAMHEDRPCAFSQFVNEIHDLCFSLFRLEREGEVTEGELDLLVKLAEPIIEVHRRELEEEQKRKRRLIEIRFNRLRRRGHRPLPDWSHRSSRENSAAPSIA